MNRGELYPKYNFGSLDFFMESRSSHLINGELFFADLLEVFYSELYTTFTCTTFIVAINTCKKIVNFFI